MTKKKFWFWLGLAIATCFLIVFSEFQPGKAQEPELTLPPLQVHPLPPSLAQWQDEENQGDYFAQVKPSPAGYLVWWEFPLKVYLERLPNPQDRSASSLRFQKWTEAVLQAIQEWNIYLPLVEVPQPELADIIIQRVEPPLDSRRNPETGNLEVSRARAAQTRYDFYLRRDRRNQVPILSQRMTIQISPRRSPASILATSRHELGHALGIWGHSNLESDALYVSQVANPPPISVRDINTLKKIYQQPTRLGWALAKSQN
jgi:predicted Zn-dependent protease